jgi:hypothetical protein
MNVNAILSELSSKFKDQNHNESSSELSRKDKKLLNHLISIFEESIDEIESEEVLIFKDEDIDFNQEMSEMDAIRNFRKYNLEQMKEIVDLKYVRKWNFKTIKNKYKLLTDEKEIWRYQKYIDNGGNNFQKWFEVSEKLFNKLKSARERYLPIHDHDLKRWALELGNEVGLSRDEFKASDTWILQFKRRFKISSRRITKFVTKRQYLSQEEIENKSIAFTLECRDKCANFRRSNIINFDQSGFNYELTIPRTLSFSGEKKTFCLNKCSHAMTHSYTVLPSLLASGEFLPKCLLILQEIGGDFGPQVRIEVDSMQEKFKNLLILASRSGMMQSNHFPIYKNEVLSKYINNSALLVHDGWRAQTNDIFEDLPNFERIIIPDGCTDKNQPLDLIVFRQWKILAKKCFMRVMIDQMDIDLRSRVGVVTLQSLIFNQLCAPDFKPMLKQAWKQYFDDGECEYLTVKDICFKDLPNSCDLCRLSSFIKCSHCRLILCFPCFFSTPHLHF